LPAAGFRDVSGPVPVRLHNDAIDRYWSGG